jgi:hypothetical protein
MERLRFTDRSYPQFPQRVGSVFWTQNNSLSARLPVGPSSLASLSRRTCVPTAPASSRRYGRRSRDAPTCRLGVRGGRRPRRMTPDRDARSNSIVHVPEYPGVYLEEVELPAKSIEGVSTSTNRFVGSVRRAVDAIAKAAAAVALGMLLGVGASIAVDKWRRRRVPPA